MSAAGFLTLSGQEPQVRSTLLLGQISDGITKLFRFTSPKNTDKISELDYTNDCQVGLIIFKRCESHLSSGIRLFME